MGKICVCLLVYGCVLEFELQVTYACVSFKFPGVCTPSHIGTTSLCTEVLFLVGVGQMSSSWNLEIIIQNMYGQCCSPGHAVYAYLVCWTFSESFRMRGSEVNGIVI